MKRLLVVKLPSAYKEKAQERYAAYADAADAAAYADAADAAAYADAYADAAATAAAADSYASYAASAYASYAASYASYAATYAAIAAAATAADADSYVATTKFLKNMQTYAIKTAFVESCLCVEKKYNKEWHVLIVKPPFDKPFAVFDGFPYDVVGEITEDAI